MANYGTNMPGNVIVNQPGAFQGNLIDDCCTTTCCYLCAKCQLAREIQLIKYGHAAP
ncbi:hypothetical protein HOLleu_08301 [Holothuria leucospilota]|uniref:Uncharacterized protein n=1 Tax=Holothuria leucospilota TaxID=206669 RepID=A0A9Q1HG85_HOLLE|nr:hypothetical protein HOLleu_08301 [Holothuria leucospilota]